MSIRSHHITSQPAAQGSPWSQDDWATEMAPRLPSNLERQARCLKALRRRRGVRSASDLLRGVLAYSLGGLSFRQLGAWALLIDLADLSDTAWRARLVQASA